MLHVLCILREFALVLPKESALTGASFVEIPPSSLAMAAPPRPFGAPRDVDPYAVLSSKAKDAFSYVISSTQLFSACVVGNGSCFLSALCQFPADGVASNGESLAEARGKC